ncbi:cysteine synthase [Moniliophthora roreri]|uniref:Rhodanese domain-containing protein n=1 Tax=Moniliophthora roreri TaxID=221103 RepID=A0A0W0EV14_MONRR|nr:cysteine synthase [Moniliophthora roreri]
MPADPVLNVYSGEDSLVSFYDPDKCPPVPLVELPRKLNPLRDDGVRIYAKLMSCLPALNVKLLPALNMILRAKEDGRIKPDTHTIVEYSSGSTVISLGLIANIYDIPRVKAYMSNKTTPAKLDQLRFFGVDLTVFGGHGQPEPQDPNGGIYQATVDGQQEGWYNPDQYSNAENWEAHVRWTGPQILKQMPNLSVFAASIGTSGTMTGTGLYLKDKKPSAKRIGVCPNNGERVPGPRMFSLLEPVDFPWREAVDGVEEVPSFESFEKSLELCRNGLLVGPSSGLALLGLLKYLNREKEAGRLDALRNEDGEIPCVFICCDQPAQYIREYMEKLGPDYFPKIENAELLDVDCYGYNIDWEVSVEEAYAMLFDPAWKPSRKGGIAPVAGVAEPVSDLNDKKGAQEYVVLDLRDQSTFDQSHIPGSRNLPVDSLDNLNPYRHPPTMVKQYKLLDERLSANDTEFGTSLEGKAVFTLSHRGHVGRLAMSILRNRGVKAHCIMGGSERWKEAGLWGKWDDY